VGYFPSPRSSRLWQSPCWLGSGKILSLETDFIKENRKLWVDFKMITFLLLPPWPYLQTPQPLKSSLTMQAVKDFSLILTGRTW